MISNFVNQLLIKKDLSVKNATALFSYLFSDQEQCNLLGKLILLLLRKKGEHSNELLGLIHAIRKIEPPTRLRKLPNLVDGCGTGGDGAQTINISTISSLVAAGAGARVAKHGNRSVSSQAGSSDLLESFGVKIDAPKDRMLVSLEQNNFSYFHAPLYHSSFKRFQAIRKELGLKKIKTIFNIVGPLVNPLEIKRQTIGVFRKDLVPIVAHTLHSLKYQHALIFWNYDGFDELTTTAPSFVIEINGKRMRRYTLHPQKYGFKKGNVKELKGGNVRLNRQIAIKILKGNDCSSRLDTIVLNAAAILLVSGKVKKIKEGIFLAKKSIKNKNALNVLNRLIRISHDPR